MLSIVEYVETMYVYTLEYVYIYRIYVYMYLYVNKESLLNLSLTRSIFGCGFFFFPSFTQCLYGEKINDKTLRRHNISLNICAKCSLFFCEIFKSAVQWAE